MAMKRSSLIEKDSITYKVNLTLNKGKTFSGSVVVGFNTLGNVPEDLFFDSEIDSIKHVQINAEQYYANSEQL
jgi:hypothetical protein